MDIRKSFPFESCDSCPECLIDVDDKVLFFSGESSQRVITVSCKNEPLCRRLKSFHDEEKQDGSP